MKTRFAFLCLLMTSTAFAYPDWQDFTPSKIITKSGISLKNKLIVYAEGSVNSCAGLFEGHKYRVKYVSCENGTLELEMKFKNKVSCDQGMEVVKKFSIVLPEDCFVHQGSTVVINGRKIQ